MTAEELITLVADMLIIPPQGTLNPARHEFRNQIGFDRSYGNGH